MKQGASQVFSVWILEAMKAMLAFHSWIKSTCIYVKRHICVQGDVLTVGKRDLVSVYNSFSIMFTSIQSYVHSFLHHYNG